MADTGCEKPQTYQHFKEYQLPLIKDLGYRFEIVKSIHWERSSETLYEYSVRKQKIPFRAGSRYCTAIFKADPIEHYMVHNGFHPKGSQVDLVLGIAFDELTRMRTNKRKWMNNVYPLVDHRVTRNGCIYIIEKAGYPIPHKSGCVFCPFQRKREWLWELKENPFAVDQGVAMEESLSESKNRITLRSDGVHLKEWREKALREKWIEKEFEEKDTTWDDWCDGGWCMT